MNAEKRKLYQARGHLLKAEVLLKDLANGDPDPVARPHLRRAIFDVAHARRKVYDYIHSRYGGIVNLEAYK